jgi:hypothetical protein
MTFRIPAGKHRALPLRFGFWWRRNSFAWTVKFDESGRYDLGNTDQYDINKLCGIGYLPGHHKDSARFGWRYWADRKQIELWAYCYVNGRREIKQICFCEIGKEYRIKLQVLTTSYYFDVCEPGIIEPCSIILVQHSHKKKFKYRLGVWFGGQARAPHEMEIELTKV